MSAFNQLLQRFCIFTSSGTQVVLLHSYNKGKYGSVNFFSDVLSTGASDRSFYPIFNKKFDHLETLLTIHRPKEVLSARSLCGL